MKIWTDREGNKVTGREFIARWKQGITKVTPYEQTKMNYLFGFITLIGLFCGVIISIIKVKTLWWLLIILIAGIGNQAVMLIGIHQKLKTLKLLRNMINEKEVFNV